MFGIDLKHVRTNVVGKDGSPFEVANVVMAGVAFIAQGAGAVALVFSLFPLFLMPWSDSRMLWFMLFTFLVVFAVSFYIMGWIGWTMYKMTFPKERDDKGRFAGKIKPSFVDIDGSKKLYYEYRGVKIPAEKMDKLIDTE